MTTTDRAVYRDILNKWLKKREGRVVVFGGVASLVVGWAVTGVSNPMFMSIERRACPTFRQGSLMRDGEQASLSLIRTLEE